MGSARMSAADASRANVRLAAEDGRPDVDALYRRHGNWLVAFLRRRFGRQAAEDLAQETYLRTVGAKTEIRNPRAFLARVALHAARDIAALKANRMVFWPEDEADEAVPCELEEALLVKQVVTALPEDLRVVFALSRFAGLSNKEIAERCGISVKRVEARMTKALALLAASMRD